MKYTKVNLYFSYCLLFLVTVCTTANCFEVGGGNGGGVISMEIGLYLE
jgi:hypothetical protein